MRTAVDARLGTDFHPGPAGNAALLASPLFALELTRRRRHIKMALGRGHFAGAGVTRNLERIASALAVRTAGHWTWEIAVLVTMLGTDFHRATANSTLNKQKAPRERGFKIRAEKEGLVRVHHERARNTVVDSVAGDLA